jgi:8-oxo-dGTP pyrophosphatase MutT (NUDIX family)
MNLEPQKFFVGLVDFFSIIMPGMFVAYFSIDLTHSYGILSSIHLPPASSADWVGFFFISYYLGHFIFLIGSLLDELLYKPLRGGTLWEQVLKLSKGKEMSRKWLMKLAQSDCVFKFKDNAVKQAERIMGRNLQPISAEYSINAFQWCKARLSKLHPEGLAMVQRFEADSKFFRSFSVALAILVLIYLYRQREELSLVCAVLCLFALWRYVEQRDKATQQAYWLIITLEGVKDMSASSSPAPARLDERTHAGGVVFRTCGETGEYLLVRAARNPKEWVLPKGHIEAGEKPEVTAVREVNEETGMWAKVVRRLDDVTLDAADGPVPARFFLMKFVEQGKPDETRECGWFDLNSAKERASFPESKVLLDQAELLRRKSDAKTAR